MGIVTVQMSDPMADRALLKMDLPFETYHAVT